LLVDEDLIIKAVSWVLKEAAKYNPHNPEAVRNFLIWYQYCLAA
jgi:3-methyladenine DNA glycosylase AlkD